MTDTSVIGLGAMSSALATNGYQVTVWNRPPASMATYAAALVELLSKK
jgi:3-hydroxyisobutyrate dehydrogenase-like beta-hydroxyacid dehydrogenase